jgi:pimeloyl-ACP methyl ester carboxylesterase
MTNSIKHPRWRALLLPGGVLPAEPAYRDLIAELGDDVDSRAKDLEVYATNVPPPDYSLDYEVRGIARTADEAGFDRFHLVGYSGGGASSLAFAATYPERLLSLALLEPAWAGNEGLTPEELQIRQAFRALRDVPAGDFMASFTLLQLKAGVKPPPPREGPRPDWMAKRPAGLKAFMNAFDTGRLDLERLRTFNGPVYFALGGLSNPDYYARMAERLRGVFSDFTLDIYPERHHFDPPHRIEPARVAAALRGLWARAETRPD